MLRHFASLNELRPGCPSSAAILKMVHILVSLIDIDTLERDSVIKVCSLSFTVELHIAEYIFLTCTLWKELIWNC